MESRDLAFRMRKPDLESLHIRAFADASFATNHDRTSQFGHILMLCDKQNNAFILHYTSYKSRRVARSVLGAEIYAFADTYCITSHIMLRKIWNAFWTESYQLKHNRTPRVCLTSSRSVHKIKNDFSWLIYKQYAMPTSLVRSQMLASFAVQTTQRMEWSNRPSVCLCIIRCAMANQASLLNNGLSEIQLQVPSQYLSCALLGLNPNRASTIPEINIQKLVLKIIALCTMSALNISALFSITLKALLRTLQ